MHIHGRNLSAAMACIVCSLAIATVALAQDLALDPSLPADQPMVSDAPMGVTVPEGPLPAPVSGGADIPMLGSALDLESPAQVGEAPDGER